MSQTSLHVMDDPFLSRNLFSYHFIKDRFPKESKIWNESNETNLEAFIKIKELYATVNPNSKEQYTRNEANLEKDFIRPILDILGHSYDVQEPLTYTYRGSQRPDYTLFRSEEERIAAGLDRSKYASSVIGLAEAKAWNLDLDKTINTGTAKIINPTLQINNYLRDTNISWGILTNGINWRLYNKDAGLRLDSYYEVNLSQILAEGSPEDFKYFYLFFRKEAFIRNESNKSLLDEILSGSIQYSSNLEEDVKGNIYDSLTLLIQGFLEHPDNNLNESDLETIHKNSLIFLYRILFILFAESKGLLPIKNQTYEKMSLQRIRKEIKIEKDKVSSDLTTSGEGFWTSINSLFKLINSGSESRHIQKEQMFIPAYNGGLFDPKKHPFLEKNKVGDKHLSEAIHLLSWSQEDTSRVGFIDYSSLSIRHLGSIYEGLLEFKPKIAKEDMIVVKLKGKEIIKPAPAAENRKSRGTTIKKGEIFLQNDSGERKASGSYYTPDYIVKYIVENNLKPIIEDLHSKNITGMDFVRQLLSINVLDPAMGSGHFLVEATSYLAIQIVEALSEAGENFNPSQESDILWARREVARRCIYGVDLNPLSVELAKVSLWLHTVTKDKPLSFLDHHLKCGNSLLGAKLTDTRDYPIGKRERKEDMNLPGYISEIFINKLIAKIDQIDILGDDRLEDVKLKEKLLEEFTNLPEYTKAKAIADVYLSAYFNNIVPPTEKKTSANVYYDLLYSLNYESNWEEKRKTYWFKQAAIESQNRRFFHWELEFPEIFFNAKEQKRNPGFDVVLGNPPYISNWQLTSIEKTLPDNLAKIYPNVATGHWDLYILFIKRGIDLTKKEGTISYIVPNSFANEGYGKGIRKEILEQHTIKELVDFGTEKPFGKVARQFMIFTLVRGVSNQSDSRIIKSKQEQMVYSHSIKQSTFKELKNFTFRFDITEEEIELKKQMEKNSKLLGHLCCINVGVVAHSKEGSDVEFSKSDIISKIPNPHYKKFVAGDDIQRYGLNWSGYYMNYLANIEKFHRPKYPELFENPKIIIRRVSGIYNQILSHLDNEGFYSNDNVILTLKWNPIIHQRQNDGSWKEDKQAHDYDLAFLQSIINSKAMAFYFSTFLATDTLQSDYTGIYPEDVRSFPIPEISFNIPSTDDDAVKQKLLDLYKKYLFNLDLADIDLCLYDISQKWVTLRVKPIHDFLAYLANEFTRLNHETNESIASFIKWIGSPMGLDVNYTEMKNRSIIEDFFKDSNLGTPDGLKKIESAMASSNHHMNTDLLRKLEDEYFSTSTKIIKTREHAIATDNLINYLVLRLYGLDSAKEKILNEEGS